VMARILDVCDVHRWQPAELATNRPQDDAVDAGLVGVVMTLSGGGILRAPAVLAQVDGVTRLRRLDEDAE
jgi:putative Mg2+ transporter-C (MgtC) family protein